MFVPERILDKKVWGGSRLGESIGEAYVVSSLDDFNNTDELDVNYILKVIDTVDNLSVQLHPQKKNRKDECWYILEANEGAGIYLGVKEGVTQEQFTKTIHENGDLSSLLNFIPVKSGDFFYVPAGTVHAIGKGIFLLEAQQKSGVTLRLWDWNRLGLDGKPRELHIEEGIKEINWEYKPGTHPTSSILLDHSDFKVEKLTDCQRISLCSGDCVFDLEAHELVGLARNECHLDLNVSKKYILTRNKNGLFTTG